MDTPPPPTPNSTTTRTPFGQQYDCHAPLRTRLVAGIIDNYIIGGLALLPQTLLLLAALPRILDLPLWTNPESGQGIGTLFALLAGAFIGGWLLTAATYWLTAETRWGTTVGKATMNLAVVNHNDQTPTGLQTLGRLTYRLASMLLLGLPHLLAARHTDRHTLGDHLTNTRTIAVANRTGQPAGTTNTHIIRQTTRMRRIGAAAIDLWLLSYFVQFIIGGLTPLFHLATQATGADIIAATAIITVGHLLLQILGLGAGLWLYKRHFDKPGSRSPGKTAAGLRMQVVDPDRFNASRRARSSLLAFLGLGWKQLAKTPTRVKHDRQCGTQIVVEDLPKFTTSTTPPPPAPDTPPPPPPAAAAASSP